MCIAKVNPAIRLKALSEWMAHYIDKWPLPHLPFERYMYLKYSEFIPDSISYQIQQAKRLATNCFYCNLSFDKIRKTGGDSMAMITVDHFMPQSSRKKCDKFVICCSTCNGRKGNEMPDIFASRLVKSDLMGLPVMGFSPKKIKTINKRVQQITNDMLYNAGPKVYYWDNRRPNKLK